jgi:hypothetical protein
MMQVLFLLYLYYCYIINYYIAKKIKYGEEQLEVLIIILITNINIIIIIIIDREKICNNNTYVCRRCFCNEYSTIVLLHILYTYTHTHYISLTQ